MNSAGGFGLSAVTNGILIKWLMVAEGALGPLPRASLASRALSSPPEGFPTSGKKKNPVVERTRSEGQALLRFEGQALSLALGLSLLVLPVFSTCSEAVIGSFFSSFIKVQFFSKFSFVNLYFHRIFIIF